MGESVNAAKYFISNDEAATEALGAALVTALNIHKRQISSAVRVGLYGGLGAGKTTLVRGLLRSLGVQGAVRSPTYSLLEHYSVENWQCLHLDLYRLTEPRDVLGLGLADFDLSGYLWLIEWPERAAGVLPAADLILEMQSLANTHQVVMRAGTVLGCAWLIDLSRLVLLSEFVA